MSFIRNFYSQLEKLARTPYTKVYGGAPDVQKPLETVKRQFEALKPVFQQQVSRVTQPIREDWGDYTRQIRATQRATSSPIVRSGLFPYREPSPIIKRIANLEVPINKPFSSFLTSRRPQISMVKPLAPFLSERPEIQPIRQKLTTGQRLTPQETKIAEEATLYRTMDVAQLSSPLSKVKPPSKYTSSINVERMALTKKGEDVLRKTVDKIKPELEKIRGKPLTHEEIIESAKTSQLLQKITDRAAVLKEAATTLRTRQQVTSFSNKIARGEKLAAQEFSDYLESVRMVNASATSKGQALEFLKIEAREKPLYEKLIGEVVQVEKNTAKVLKAAEGIDFTDMNQATKFYREFIKPSKTEWLDWFRYQNMLSSPQTWMTNIMSNIMQIPLGGAEKLTSGVIDNVSSRLTGKARQYYVREVPAYGRGVFNSFRQSADDAIKALRGETAIRRPDVAGIPPSVNPIARAYGTVTRIMEAGDVFVKGIIKAGEREAIAYKLTRQGKTFSLESLDALADETAMYRIFRGGQPGQGPVLNAFDQVSNAAYAARKIPGMKWAIPFIETPMRILKQGIEYSPAGFATIPGSAQKNPQLAKSIIGSIVTLGTLGLIWDTETAWEPPKGKNQQSIWYAQGKKQHSIKIGDNYVSIDRLGVLAYPLGFALAIKHSFQENPNEAAVKNLARVMPMMVDFFANQSYIETLGLVFDLFDERSRKYAAEQMQANVAGQLVPMRALLGWISRLTDKIYRDPDGVKEILMSQLPGLSQQVSPFYTPGGEPSQRTMAGNLTPAAVGAPAQGSLDREMIRLGVAIGSPATTFTYKKTQLKWSDEQYKKYDNAQRILAQSRLKRLIADPRWSRLSDTKKKELIEKTISESRKTIRKLLLKQTLRK